MKTRCCLFLLMTAFILGAYGQSQDSVLYSQGTAELRAGNLDSAELHLQAALDLSDQSENFALSGNILNNLSIVFKERGDYSKSAELVNEAILAYEKTGNDTLIGVGFYNLGLSYKRQGINDLAIRYIKKAMLIFEEYQIMGYAAIAHYASGNLYKNMGSFDKAVYHHKTALVMYERLNDTGRIAKGYHNLAHVYVDCDSLEMAHRYITVAIRLKKLINASTATSHAILGEYYIKTDQLDSAEFYFYKSLKTRLKERKPDQVATGYRHMGDLYKEKLHLDEASAYFDSSYFIADSLGLEDELLKTLLSQIEVMKLMVHDTSLIQKYDRILELEKKNQGKESLKELAAYEVRYEVLKKDQEIENLNIWKKSLGIGIVLAVVFGLIIVFVLIKLRRSIAETETKNRQLMNSHQQIDNLHKELSHRTKNYFQMFNGMLAGDKKEYEGEEIRKLIETYISRVDAMSQIQRYLLESDEQVGNHVQLNLYLSDLLANINLLLNNFNPKVKIVEQFEVITCDYDQAMRLGIVMNELVTNAFEHGFVKVVDPKLELLLQKEQSKIVLYINDNGIGFKPASNAVGSKGIGLIKNVLKKINGELVYDHKKDKGTAIKINIPQ